MALKRRDDPYGAYNFEVSVEVQDGKSVKASFTEISGLELSVDPIEYRNGNDDKTPRKFSGIRKYGNITLKRGITGDAEFWEWILEAANGKERKVNGSIHLLDEDRKQVFTWKVKNAWPCKFTGPSMNATSNEIAMETVEVCHEGLDVDTIGAQG